MDYKKVDIATYVKEGLENNTLIPIVAEKFAKIMAKQGNVGTQVISWSVDQKGNPLQEKIDRVTLDNKTNQPGWIVTKVDEKGNVIVDKNGHVNSWIIKDSVFKEKYEVDKENIFKPKSIPQVFVQTKENITIIQRNSIEKLTSGGYINITNPEDLYGIQEKDFQETYKIVSGIEMENII